ncbi:hypothetical protein BN1708_016973, partial [Verticillium longisporum]
MAAAVDQKIPAFENTSLDDITRVTDTLRATFRSYKTKDIQWRLVQLRKFYWAFEDYTPALINALRQDLRKSKHEALLSEINWIKDDCLYLIKNLERFTKDEPVSDVPMTFIMMKPRVRKEPLGMTPHEILPKLFGELKTRYAERPGGYTRVLRTEPRNAYDQAPSAILELVDGPRDLRFTMTAKAVARGQHEGWAMNDVTQKNVDKVTRYREGGKKALDKLVSQF